MNNYFSLTKEQQQKVLQAAENKIGLPEQEAVMQECIK
jgi:hypothetical protein